MAGVEYGRSVYVPSEGWIVFGRLGNSLETAQKLTSLDSDWKAGPALLQGYHKEAQCLVQVIKKETKFHVETCIGIGFLKSV
jgi:hypothetical protein